MERLAEELKKWGIEGFNNHEGDALRFGYLGAFFPGYLPFKNTLLKLRDADCNRNAYKYHNVLRIYAYTIFENMWYGYLVSHSEAHISAFFNSGKLISYDNQFFCHLPSFSAAIVHIGTCRDLFFVLLRFYANSELVGDSGKMKKVLNGKDKGDVRKDIRTLSSDGAYLQLAEEFINANRIRNFFVHRLRLPWWHSGNCHEQDYFLPRDFYEAISVNNQPQQPGCPPEKDKRGTNKSWAEHIEEIFFDEAAYKKRIENTPCDDLISAREVLQEIHDPMAKFLNTSFGLMAATLR